MNSKISWKDDLISAMENIGSPAAINEICNEVYSLRSENFRSTPNKLRQTVQRTLQNFSSDASDFKKPQKDDIFYMAEGKGKGVWGMR